MKRIYQSRGIVKDEERFLLEESLFHCGNGYLGVRGNYEEGYLGKIKSIRGQYINGFYDIVPMKQAEQLYGFVDRKQMMLNIADTQSICVYVDGEMVREENGIEESAVRTLDMDNGFTERNFDWESSTGKKISVCIRRMASFYMLPLFTIEFRIIPRNFSGKIKIVSGHNGQVTNYSNPDDPRVAAESGNYLKINQILCDQENSFITSETTVSGLQVTTAVGHTYENMVSESFSQNREMTGVTAEWVFDVEKGRDTGFVKYTVMCDSRRYEDTMLASKFMEKAKEKPLKFFYKKQREYLSEFWRKANIQVEGDDLLSQSLNFNLYCLLQAVSKDSVGNIAAKGMSGEGYEGHYFWDTEMYIFPFFMLTERKIARNLLEFRYNILSKAKENAKILGHKKGALFPWRTINGTECSGYYPSGTAQYHINSDIAYAVVNYYFVTKDEEFLELFGEEILIETARLWMDVGHYEQGSFRIPCVTGPDEYTCMVNNNYYTNASAKFNLYWAAKLYQKLSGNNRLVKLKEKLKITEKEIEEFWEAAENMYLPYDKEKDINPQDDSFLQKETWNLQDTPAENFPLLLHYHPLHLYRYQVCKQADTVLAHFIHEDLQPLHTIKNSFEYYEKITTHDSSLSTCIFGIVAARLGDIDKAYEYFEKSSKLDITNAHKNTGDGIHTANMGGTYMGIVYGFGGLRIREKGLSFRPIIPEKWRSYSYRIEYEDSVIDISTDREKTTFTMKQGSSKQIWVYDQLLELKEQLQVLLQK